jgi:hypothetical protein
MLLSIGLRTFLFFVLFYNPSAVCAEVSLGATTLREFLGDTSLVSSEGRDIEILRPMTQVQDLAVRSRPDRFLIQGGLHGNEVTTTQFVTWLARRYARGQSLLNRFSPDLIEIDFVPLTNPDGAAAFGRVNARGVNLNRNFGVLWGMSREYPGPHKFSEPETRALEKLFRARSYLAAVDIHGFIDWVVAPSHPEEIIKQGFRVTDERRGQYQNWHDNLAKELEIMPGYTLKTAAALGDGGAFEDWAFWDQKTFAFCLELESLKRYFLSDGQRVIPFASAESRAEVDTFLRYEAFIFRMFEHAWHLRHS